MSSYESNTNESIATRLSDYRGRPEDCRCWDATLNLPCWPCYREGFRKPNPAEPDVEEYSF